jgi:transcriptional regulator with XRE-family HTH domain
MGLTREELATKLELSSPSRIRVWETGLERPRPRFVPRLAAAQGVDPLHLLDVDAGDPPLAALRLAAGLATNEVTAPGMSVMTYVRLEDGRSGAEPSAELTDDEQEREAATLSGELMIPAEAALRMAWRDLSDEGVSVAHGISLAAARWRMNSSGARLIVKRTKARRARLAQR